MTPMTNAPASPAAGQNDAVLWQHRALCGLALPLRAPRDRLWSREAAGAGLAMGTERAVADEAALPLPAGRGARLLLLHVFTVALRAGSTAAEVGPDAAAVARGLEVEASAARLRELEEQMARLLAARLRVVETQGAPPLAVLDTRRLGKNASAAWRPVLHLGARFLASLQRNAVALDRGVVSALAGSAPALDAYAWLAATLPGAAAEGRPVLASWADLSARFGQGGASPERFRAAFAESLEAVRAAWPAADLAVGDGGVVLRGLAAPGGSTGAASAAASSVVGDPPGEPAPPGAAPPSPPEARADPERGPGSPEPTAPAASPSVPAAAAPVAPGDPAGRPSPRPPERDGGLVRLAPGLTGLDLSVWLRRGEGGGAVIEVTPGADYHPSRRSLLIVEPVILQVAGHLRPGELEQVAAWAAANAELIEEYWDGTLASAADLARRVRPVPAASRW